MGLFSKKSEGGLMDVIRCDEQEYLVWKWRPSGEANSTKKENAIRWGSSLRVKDGEVAVFVYKEKDGSMQDFIEGPQDEIIKTANFPVITSIIGLAYDGKSPFQAEIYFINLADRITHDKNGQLVTAPTKNWRFSASYDSFVVNQTFVLRMNICGKNRQIL